ncbi:SapC family protein [Sphingobium baderi]|uniref:SapC family protein n=1 Tax=Sphingobium baderi TaxID=1332080 RepID=UPI002B40F579|nr:SapC family protein [Sphingobium baderi]WRD78880.1 SapC family protein [Sphingobium baderi]
MSEARQKVKKGGASVVGPKVRGSLPLYGEPRAVHSVTHRDVAVHVGRGDFSFARKAPMIQITVDEFERAAINYPIVFFGEDHQSYVVTGLDAERNLFVADDGYRPDAYVPAYLRRYPFVFARDDDSEALILCLDHGSERVGKVGDEGAVALFDGHEPTALTRQALEFCENYEAAQGRTRKLASLLREFDLLEVKQVHYTPPGEATPNLLLEYRTIDRSRLDALSPEDFLKLREAGALPAIFAQTASQANWDMLAVSRRQAEVERHKAA